jgi:hypothetical protein
MQLGYVNKVTFGPAITSAYASKRAAEAAPGVGSATDIHIVFNDHIEPVREDVSKKAEELWENYRKERLSLEVKTYLEMEAFIKTVGGSPTKKDAEN